MALGPTLPPQAVTAALAFALLAAAATALVLVPAASIARRRALAEADAAAEGRSLIAGTALGVHTPTHAAAGMRRWRRRVLEQLLADAGWSLADTNLDRLRAVAEHTGVIRRARRCLRSRRWHRRLHAVRLLAALGAPGPADELARDRHPAVRAAATVWAAGALADDEDALVRVLQRRLVDDDANVRAAARFTAAAVPRAGVAAATAQVTAWRAWRRPVPVAALRVLAELPAPQVAEHLAGMYLQADSDDDRAVVLPALRHADPDTARDHLAAAASSRSPQLRAAAATCCAGQLAAVPVLAELFTDPDAQVRKAARQALDMLGASGALVAERLAAEGR